MKELKHIKLSDKLIKKICTYFPSKKYKTLSPLFYEGQIPISGYLILNGSIQITNKKKYKKILMSGALVGLTELMNKIPSKMNAEVFPNTEVCFLDKSSLNEFKEKADPELQDIFREVTEERR